MSREYETDDAGPWAYESVAERRKKAVERAQHLAQQGEVLEPAVTRGKKMASTFWGQAWNRNLERYEIYAHRLKLGRSVVRNGQVLDMKVQKGVIHSLVSGAELYQVNINIEPIDDERWDRLKRACSGRIGSLVDWLRSQLSTDVMEKVIAEGTGLFPEPSQIRFICDCPDYAEPCEHAAAAAYGLGCRLDEQPELLFLLRGVDHLQLMETASQQVLECIETGEGSMEDGAGLKMEDLPGIFGIEMDGDFKKPDSKFDLDH